MRNPYRNLARVLVPILALWSTPALAQWETAHGIALKPGGKCPAPHGRDPQLRRSDGGTFDIPAGFRGEIEIYGHGVDLIRRVSMSGGFASYSRSVGGPENGTRGCDAIGSIVIRFEIPYDTGAGTRTLTFGDQTMQVRIVKPSILRTVWSPQTLKGRSTVGGGPAPTPAPPPPPPPPPPTVNTSGSNGCGPAGGCNSDSSMVFVGTPGSASSPDDPPRLADAVGGCIDELGGSAAIQGTTLTLTLPNARSDRFDIPCLTRPVFFNVEMGPVSDDIGGFRGSVQEQWFVDRGRAVDPPRYSGSLNGFTGPSPVDDANRDYQALRMTAETARTFVGERRILLSPPSGSGASQLTLVLRTDPGYGINAIQVPSFGPNGRLGNTLDVKYDFLPFGNGSTNVFWRLRSISGAAPGTCFTAGSGTNSGAGGGVGKIALTARDGAGCDNSRFAIDIGPARNGAGLFSAPFSKTAEFVLVPRSTTIQVNPNLPQNPSGRPPLLN